MQPQTPTPLPPINPNPYPTPQPGPVAPAPQPVTTPPADPFPQPLAPKKPNFLLMIAGVIGASLVSMAITSYFVLFTGIALETYENDNLTVQVPVGYERKDTEDGMLFREPGSPLTASAVTATYSAYPNALPEDQLAILKDSFKAAVADRIQIFAPATERLEDLKIEETDFKGTKAYRVTARAMRQGKTEYTIKMIAVLEPTRMYMVGVAAHASDQNFGNSIDTIINSISVK